MPYLKTSDNTEIHYRDWGTGIPVVLIHGWPLNGDMWEKQAEHLAANGLRAITYDRRGFGLSSQPWNGYDYDTFAADLHMLMEGLDLKGAVLVGFSMGGGEVARYLSRYGSSRVARAVLVSAVTPYLMETADNPEGVDPETFQKIEASLREDRFAFLKDFATGFYGRSLINRTVSDAVLQWSFGAASMASLHSTLASAQAWSTTDFREDLRAITVPLLVIHGTSDQTVPIEKSARRVPQLVPGAILVEYEGEPHGLFLTAANRLNADLLEFAETGVVTPPKESLPENYYTSNV